MNLGDLIVLETVGNETLTCWYHISAPFYRKRSRLHVAML